MKNINKEFNREEALQMFEEMVTWLSKNQVIKPGDPNRGAIYFPTEDRFCNRDTACMARVFMRQYVLTGDDSWLKKAALARDYVLRVQKSIGGFPEMRGLEESDEASTVNTSIIASNLIKAYELGLPCGECDLKALKRMAEFVMTLEWKPGAFYHDTNHSQAFENRWGDEGSHLDCQNTTALAAMMLQNIYYFLEERGDKACPCWLNSAGLAVQHLLDGQKENGHWPYLFNAEWQDAGHHAMCMFYLMQAAKYPPHSTNKFIVETLERGARWLIDSALLQTKLGTKINWAAGRSACLYFTTEYFFIAAPLAQIANMGCKDNEEYRHEALELMRYVRTDLWNNQNYDKEGPFRLTEAGIKIGYAWFGQSMGWAIYQFDELIEQMGWWKPSET
jgi:hypothetical protein